MEAYDTKTGQKIKSITYQPPRKDDASDAGYYDDSTAFYNITSSDAMGYIAACISCIEYVDGNYGQVYRLVCFDVATSDVLAVGYCRYYQKMFASKVLWTVFAHFHISSLMLEHFHKPPFMCIHIHQMRFQTPPFL